MRKNSKLALLLLVCLGVNYHVNAQEIPDSTIVPPATSESTPPASSEMTPPAGSEANPALSEATPPPASEDPGAGAVGGGYPMIEDEDEVVAVEDLADTSAVIMDGYMTTNNFKRAKPIPLPEINPANVKFYKRIWRDIDLKDPKNSSVFFSMDGSLTELLVSAVKKGKIIAYDPRQTKKNPTGDGFTTKLPAEQALSRLVDSVLVQQFDENGNVIGSTMQLNEFNPENITKYRLKEDIFFDRQRSKYETRIVGIAPLKKVNAGGEELSEVVFWLHYPSIRKVLVTRESKDGLSFDDIFIQRSFVSQIIRDSKNPGQKIEDPALAEKQLKEQKEKIWKY
jgi:gliding motility associated protien GldN